MGTARRQYPDEFKREALEHLVSSGQPLSQIAGELGNPPERLRAWRNGGGAKLNRRGAPTRGRRSRLLAWIWLPRMLACGARTSACAWSVRS